jgi:WD40 repeat protein
MFVGHMAAIKKLVFSPDGKYLFSISNDCDGVIIWEFMGTPDSAIDEDAELFVKKEILDEIIENANEADQFEKYEKEVNDEFSKSDILEEICIPKRIEAQK